METQRPLGPHYAYQCTHNRVPEGEKRLKGSETAFEKIMAQNSPNLMKIIDLHIQEAQKYNLQVG